MRDVGKKGSNPTTQSDKRMQVIVEKCKGCGTCVLDCPQGAITLSKKIAVIGDACSQCGACLKVCPEEAIFSDDAPSPLAATCEACPICCRIKEGYTGACQRFMNRGGVLERTIPLKTVRRGQTSGWARLEACHTAAAYHRYRRRDHVPGLQACASHRPVKG